MDRFKLHTISLFLVLVSLTAQAQLRLKGEVRHAEKGIADARILVYERGRLVRTIAADKRGNYEADFNFDRAYTLVYKGAKMVPVHVDVNTSFTAGSGRSDVLISVPLNMDLYYHFADLDTKGLDASIGVVRQTAVGQASFEFYPDQDVLARFKRMKSQSIALESAGAPATDPDMLPVNKSAGQMPTESPEKQSEESAAEGAGTSDVPSKREAERYAMIEQASLDEASREKERLVKSQSVSAVTNNSKEDYLAESKHIHAEAASELEASKEAVTDARVYAQQTQINSVLAAAESARTRNDHLPVAVKRGRTEGWMSDEEWLVVHEAGEKRKYVKVVYHWVLFDATYYYMNDQEIPREVYEKALRLF